MTKKQLRTNLLTALYKEAERITNLAKGSSECILNAARAIETLERIHMDYIHMEKAKRRELALAEVVENLHNDREEDFNDPDVIADETYTEEEDEFVDE
jgi:hypothetical protein